MTQPIYDESILSDLYKDAYGSRPGQSYFAMWDAMTVEQRNAEWNCLVLTVEGEIADDLAREIAAIIDYEDTLRDLQESGAASREVAISWFVASLGDVNHDAGYVCYLAHLPYRMEFEFAPFV